MPFTYCEQNFKLIQSETPDPVFVERLRRKEAAAYLIEDVGVSEEVRVEVLAVALRQQKAFSKPSWNTNMPGVANPMKGFLHDLGVRFRWLSTSREMWTYRQGGDLPWHTDSVGEPSDITQSFKASAVICLSAGQQGDIELANTHYENLVTDETMRMRFSLKAGQGLVMPNFLVHRVMEVVEGCRVTLVETFPLFENY